MGNQPYSSLTIPESGRSFQLQNNSNIETHSSQRIGHKIITVKNNEELKILKKNFDFRLRHRQFLAHLYGFEVGDNQAENTLQKIQCKSLFSSTKVTLHYEKVTQQFSNLYNVSIQQGSKLLQHCLIGFSILFDNYGYFTPEPKNIFKQGQSWVVWVSDNIFSIKNQIEVKNQDNLRLSCKFWQKIIHLFDVLRDEQNPQFSYSSYIYGNCASDQPLKRLQLSEIFQKLNQISKFRNQNKNSRELLRKLRINSDSTVRKQDLNVNLSFESNTNDATLSKFKNNMCQFPKNIANSKQTAKSSKNSLKFQNKQTSKPNQTSEIILIQKDQNYQKQNLFNFISVPSSHVKLINNNQIEQKKINLPTRHIKNQFSISTNTNCTGQANQIIPLKIYGNPNQVEKNFLKRQRAMTVDCSVATNFHPSQSKLQPRKITQNSQGNSESSQKVDDKEEQNQDSFQSQDQKDQVILFGPSQFIDQNQSIKATSISGNNKKFEKQSMKNLQEYLDLNFKTQHRRSLTDQVVLNGQNQNKKIKLCLSQYFDSEFFSTCSKIQIPSTNKLFINGLASGKSLNKQMNSEVNISIGNTSIRNSEKQIRKVRISEQNNKMKIIKDSILQHSELQNSCSGPKEASIAKLAVFKSQGGLKSLLGTKIGTLMSIKQIDVQVPIDEQILYDLNKMFPRHHFSKSTKITH